jgi:hypothetical protein
MGTVAQGPEDLLNLHAKLQCCNKRMLNVYLLVVSDGDTNEDRGSVDYGIAWEFPMPSNRALITLVS